MNGGDFEQWSCLDLFKGKTQEKVDSLLMKNQILV